MRYAAGLLIGFALAARQAHGGVSLVTAEVLVEKPIASRVHEVVEEYATSNDVAYDPAVEEAINAGLGLFAFTFCDPGDRYGGDRCKRTLLNDGAFRRGINNYLKQVTEDRSKEVTAIAETFSAMVGNTIAAAGWPTTVRNDFGIVLLQEVPDDASVDLQTATGPVRLGIGKHRVVLLQGTRVVRITDADGVSHFLTADVKAHESVAARRIDSQTMSLGAIEPTDDLFCSDRIVATYEGPLAYYNWCRAQIDATEEDRLKHLAPFARQYAIQIDAIDDTHQCDSHCKEGLGIAFAQALSVWRTGCDRCDSNALVLVRVGDHAWMDGELVGRLHRSRNGNAALDLSTRDTSSDLTRRGPPRTLPGRNLVVSYEQVDGNSDIRSSVCALDNSDAPWVAQSKELLCNGHAPGRTLRPMVHLVVKDTACGPSHPYFACGVPNSGIEATVDDIAYRIATPHGEVVVGDQRAKLRIDMRSVVLHEVGHWFGVPHVEVIGKPAFLDIMSMKFGKGKTCVSSQSLVMMNNAADTRWSWRVTQGGGLMRPDSEPAMPQTRTDYSR